MQRDRSVLTLVEPKALTRLDLVDDVVDHLPISRSCGRSFRRRVPAALPQSVTRAESKQTFLSLFQRAAEVVDLLHAIPAARQRGGGGGENSAGLRLSRSRAKEEERGGD